MFCTCSLAVMSAAMPPTPVGELTRASGLLDGGVAGTSCVDGWRPLGGVPGMTLSADEPRGLAVKPGGVLGLIVAWCSGPSQGSEAPHGVGALSFRRIRCDVKVPERRDMD